MSGLLPRNGVGSGSANGSFAALQSKTLVVSGSATVNNLTMTGDATANNLTVTGIFVAPGGGGVDSDVYQNATPNSTVTLRTTGGNADVLLTPNGGGAVTVKSGAILKADVVANSTAGAPVLIATQTSSAPIQLSPDGTGSVVVKSGSSLTADTVSATTTNAPLTLSSNGTGDVLLTPAGSGVVSVKNGTILRADVLTNSTAGAPALIATQTSNAPIQLSPDGTGSVVVKSGSSLTADTISATTTNAPLTLSSNGTGDVLLTPAGSGTVAVKNGTVLRADILTNSTTGAPVQIATQTSNADIQLSPNGVGSVVVKSGSALRANTLTATTPGATLTLAAVGSGSVQINAPGGFIGCSSGSLLLVDNMRNVTPGVPLEFASNGSHIACFPDASFAFQIRTGTGLQVGDIRPYSGNVLSLTAPTLITLNTSGGTVRVASGGVLTTDNLSTTAAGPLLLSAPSGAINLQPSTNVVISTGTGLRVNAITDAAGGNTATINGINPAALLDQGVKTTDSPTFVAVSAPTLNANTVSTLSGTTLALTAPTLLTLNTTAGTVRVNSGTTLTADTLSTTSAGPLLLSAPSGDINLQPSTNVVISTGTGLRVNAINDVAGGNTATINGINPAAFLNQGVRTTDTPSFAGITATTVATTLLQFGAGPGVTRRVPVSAIYTSASGAVTLYTQGLTANSMATFSAQLAIKNTTVPGSGIYTYSFRGYYNGVTTTVAAGGTAVKTETGAPFVNTVTCIGTGVNMVLQVSTTTPTGTMFCSGYLDIVLV